MRKLSDDEVTDLIHLLYLREYAEERLYQCIMTEGYREFGTTRALFGYEPRNPRRAITLLAMGYQDMLHDVEMALLRHLYTAAGFAQCAWGDDEPHCTTHRDGRTSSRLVHADWHEIPEFAHEDAA